MVVKCDNYGCDFQCTPSRYNNAKEHCCSKKCQSEYRKSKDLNYQCDVCGKPFHIKPYHLNKYKNHFCSRDCKAEWNCINMQGDKNHQFGLKGALNPTFKSNKKISPYGYILIRKLDHPFSNCDGFVFEHRLIAEQYLLTDTNSVQINGNKYLKPECVVHHIDFNRKNNNIKNLYVFENESTHGLFHTLYKNKRISDLQDFLHYYQEVYVNKLYNYEWLYDVYINQNLSMNKISQKFNIPYTAISIEIHKQQLNKAKAQKKSNDRINKITTQVKEI